ncbi:MAG: stage III sporulation protein AF [Clostridia bacterium]|nr:stage III sporulation protein AF [Clostridia bacterium]
MSGWILSIVGMVLTMTLTEIMLPEGQTAKYIKGVVSLMVVYVVIAPVPALLQSKIDINSFFDFSSASYESDDAFIQLINEDKQSALGTELTEVFVASGLKSSSAIVLTDNEGAVFRVILTASLSETDQALRLTRDRLGIKEEQIVINELFT